MTGLLRSMTASRAALVVVLLVLVCPLLASANKAPTRQVFVQGSGTYFTPNKTRPLYLRVRMVGAGGGGGGPSYQLEYGSEGHGGGATVFDIYSAGGGGGGTVPYSYGEDRNDGGFGGLPSQTAASPTGSFVLAFNGNAGQGGLDVEDVNPGQIVSAAGGSGGSTTWGGGGTSVATFLQETEDTTAGDGAGGGGGTVFFTDSSDGGASVQRGRSGGGGGSGAFMEIVIAKPAKSYQYSVGVGGAGGQPTEAIGVYGTETSGTEGGGGLLIVEEFYQ